MSPKRHGERLRPAAPDSEFRHPDWPYAQRPAVPAFQRTAEAVDANDRRGTIRAFVYYMANLEQIAVLGIPPEFSRDAIMQWEDYSEWQAHRDLEVVTIGVRSSTYVPHARLVHYAGASEIPYIAVTYQAARLRGTVGYGVLWSPFNAGEHVMERVEGFDVRVPGFKPEHLHGAIEALKVLAGITLGSGGRPELFGDANEPQFFEALKDASHAAVREGQHVNYSTLSGHGLASRPTLKDAVERFGYDLDALEAEAVRCTQGLSICTVIWRRRDDFKKKRR